MSEILLINPSPKKKVKTKKKAVKKMAAKKRRKKRKTRSTTSSNTKTKTVIRYRTKKNPTRVRRAARAVKSNIMGIDILGAAKDAIPHTGGMLAAKFAAKKWADGGAEGEDWTWENYGLALAGGFAASVLTQAVFRKPKAVGKKVMTGALSLMMYKGFINEVAAKNETMNAWFGADDDEVHPDYMGVGADDALPGDIWVGDETDYIQGDDSYWRPVDEGHRMIPEGTMGRASNCRSTIW